MEIKDNIACRKNVKLFFSSLSYQLNPDILSVRFVNQTTWNNRQIIPETRSYIFTDVLWRCRWNSVLKTNRTYSVTSANMRRWYFQCWDSIERDHNPCTIFCKANIWSKILQINGSPHQWARPYIKACPYKCRISPILHFNAHRTLSAMVSKISFHFA
mgnify:FL=1